MLGGKPIIQRVYERVAQVFPNLYVATDDARIEAVVKHFGGVAVMTSTTHRSGTDRCFESFCKMGGDADIVVNVHGDGRFKVPSLLKAVAARYDAN